MYFTSLKIMCSNLWGKRVSKGAFVSLFQFECWILRPERETHRKKWKKCSKHVNNRCNFTKLKLVHGWIILVHFFLKKMAPCTNFSWTKLHRLLTCPLHFSHFFFGESLSLELNPKPTTTKGFDARNVQRWVINDEFRRTFRWEWKRRCVWDSILEWEINGMVVDFPVGRFFRFV